MKETILICIICTLLSCTNQKSIQEFNFEFEYNNTETFSSFDSTFRREGIENKRESENYRFKDTIIRLNLSQEEMRIILNTMVVNKVLALPSTFEVDKEKPCIVPADVDLLTVRFDNIEKKIKYSHACFSKDQVAADRFLSIRAVIISILEKKDKIKKLPSSSIITM